MTYLIFVKRFYVYEDWTLETRPRCYYVGKGDDDRIQKLKRNKFHAAVSEILGHRRIVVFETSDEQLSLQREQILIDERHTLVSDLEYNEIGCNLTRSGQGISGRIVSQETRDKISTSKKGVPLTLEARAAISIGLSKSEKVKKVRFASRGRKVSQECRARIRASVNDPGVKQSMIEKVTASINAKYRNDLEFCQRIRDTRARGEKTASPLTNEDVVQIRKEWESIDKTTKGNRWKKSPSRMFCQRWADMKNVTPQAIYGIVTRKSWKHLS